MLGIIGLFFFGLFIGVLAKVLMPGDDPGGFFVTGLIGVAGSFIGKYLGQLLGLYPEGSNAGWFMSLVGALILLGGYRLAVRARAPK